MGKHQKWIAVMLLFGYVFTLTIASAETTLKVNGVDMLYAGDFSAHYPDVKVDEETYKYYRTTSEMASDLLMDAFDYDVFVLMSDCVDHRTIMRKEYCLDLSNSGIIQNAMQELHPVFAEQCVMDGKIYAIPHLFQMNYLTFSQPILGQTGIEHVETPSSFPEFLDFIEQWISYKRANPGCNVALLGMSYWGDASFYNESSYTSFLVDQLMQNYIMQKEYQGVSIQFDKDELLPLLNRCYQLGQELFQCDAGIQSAFSIVQIGFPNSFPDDADYLSLRLDNAQPHLISTSMQLYAVNAETANPDLCIALMEQLCLNNWPQYNTLFYQNTEPLRDPKYDSEVARIQQLIQDTQDQLDSDNLDSVYRAELEYRLGRQQTILNGYLENEEKQYLITATALDNFRKHINFLFVHTPSLFHANDTERANVFRQSKSRFAAGQMSADAFLNELNNVAWMIETETD